jgi:hypothetical protein
MKKYYLSNGKEVKIGDTMILEVKNSTGVFKSEFTLIESILPTLIEHGVIVCKEEKESKEPPKDLQYYIKNIATRLGWKYYEVEGVITMLNAINPAALFSTILREIAIDLDKKYEDHISNSPEIYIVSLLDGRITKANKAIIKNYKNFAAFRTIEDAKWACGLLRHSLKSMFKSEK